MDPEQKSAIIAALICVVLMIIYSTAEMITEAKNQGNYQQMSKVNHELR